jgi:hypothetical protein
MSELLAPKGVTSIESVGRFLTQLIASRSEYGCRAAYRMHKWFCNYMKPLASLSGNRITGEIRK